MISKIKHLQFAKLYPFTRVTNTKSMTPNQLRLRAPGFKGFRHIPLGPCSGFKAKCHEFIFLFLLFFFFLLFLFFSFLEDYIGLQMWVKQTYHGLPTCLRPVMQNEKGGYTISQSISIIWCVVCELVQRGNIQVEHAGPSTDQKLLQTWNCSNMKVTCKVSIFQLKAIQLSN